MRRWVNAMPTGFRDYGDGYLGGPYKGKNAYVNLEYDVTLNFLHQFPKDLLDQASLLRQQKLSLQIKHDGLEKVLATHDQISNRISFSIVIAALIVGSALIVISKTPPLFYGISLIGIIGFLAAALMGIWLLVAILRSGRL